MNPIIAYYRFERTGAAATRMDCTASTANYPVLEAAKSNGKLFCYLCKDHNHIHRRAHQAPMAISVKGIKANGQYGCRNLTSVYPTEYPNFGSGDIPTHVGGDAVVMQWQGIDLRTATIQQGAVLHLYIIDGHAKERARIATAAAAGKLDDYMAEIKAAAISHV